MYSKRIALVSAASLARAAGSSEEGADDAPAASLAALQPFSAR